MAEKTLISWDELIKFRNIQKFPLVDKKLDLRYQKIYPLMQIELYHILKALGHYDITVRVFGSALTAHCNSASDLDISIQTKVYNLDLFYEIQKKILQSTVVECDIIYYNDLTECDRIKAEIDYNSLLMKEMGQ